MKDTIVEIKGNRYRYQYDPGSKSMIYRGPVGSAPGITEEEFERWAIYRDDADLSPDEIEKFYDEMLKSEEDVGVALDETYGHVYQHYASRSDYHLMPGHTKVMIWPGPDDENDPYRLYPNDTDPIDVGDKFIGEFDTLQEAIDAAFKDADKRMKAWEATPHEDPQDWVKAKAKKVKPDWLKELEREGA